MTQNYDGDAILIAHTRGIPHQKCYGMPSGNRFRAMMQVAQSKGGDAAARAEAKRCRGHQSIFIGSDSNIAVAVACRSTMWSSIP